MEDYISLGNACNIHCLFCYNDKERSKKQEFFTLNHVKRELIEIRKKHNFLCIVGGEPLFHPDIFEIMSFINRLSFKRTRLVTNGIRFADKEFTKKFFEYKIDVIQFSIHTHDSGKDGIISGRKNSFLDRKNGVKNVVEIIKSNKLSTELHSNSVINKHNVNEVDKLIDFIYKLGIKNLSLSFMYSINGLSERNISIISDYTSFLKQTHKIQKLINKHNSLKLSIHYLPFCFHKQISFFYKIREVLSRDMDIFINSADNIGGKEHQYKLENRIKTKNCNLCEAYGKFCIGPISEYVKLYGDAEFQALTKEDIISILKNIKEAYN
ncbi:MAG: radical SAM protein [Candidatus Gracilibacteria bacterium]|nr:radical SAM protein [Candidatus Gracilibacteria bacterium]